MSDAWEVAHGLNPNDPPEAADGRDGDGKTHLQEYRAGTDPANPLSRFRLAPVSFVTDALHLRWRAEPNHSYTLEWTPSLPLLPLLAPWTAIHYEPEQPFSHTVELTVPSDGQPRGFFRVRTP